MEKQQEVICTDCGWTGDGKGLSSCPACYKGTLAPLTETEPVIKNEEKYPENMVAKVDKEKTEDLP